MKSSGWSETINSVSVPTNLVRIGHSNGTNASFVFFTTLGIWDCIYFGIKVCQNFIGTWEHCGLLINYMENVYNGKLNQKLL